MRANEIGLQTPIYVVNKDKIYIRSIKSIQNDYNKNDIVVMATNDDWYKFKSNEAISYSNSGFSSGYLNLDDAHRKQKMLREQDLEEKRRELKAAQRAHYEAILLLSSPYSEPKK